MCKPPPPTPTPGPAPELIESDDARVSQAGTWTLHNTPAASGGSYLYSSGQRADTLNLYFEGRSVAIIYVQHQALGTMPKPSSAPKPC